MPTKIIIDTDIGTDVDDAIAVAFAALRPELDVRAITTVFGPVDKRAGILAALLKAIGRTDIPFAPGRSLPLAEVAEERKHQILEEIPNQYQFALATCGHPAPAAASAEELIVNTIEQNPNEIWLVAIGPLTNVAALLRERPSTAKKLRGIVCMGGEPHRPFREYNIGSDPEAARMVFRSGLLRFQGTYDVTRRLVMSEDHIATLRQVGTPTALALLELISLWKPVQTVKKWPVVYDVCPILWLFAPHLFATEAIAVDVELRGSLTRGMTVPVCDGPPVEVSCGVDERAAMRLLMNTLTSA